LGGRTGIQPVKTEWWGANVVVCLKQGADLHMAQLMPLPLTVSCFTKIQIGFTFLVPAHLGSPGQSAVKRVCVCVSPLEGSKTIANRSSTVAYRFATNQAICVSPWIQKLRQIYVYGG